MPPGAVSWSFTDDDFQAISGSLQRFLYDSNARCALLVDRAGQLVATVGEPPAFDATAFASLTAADFSANDQLAKLIGERDFTTLFHQGEKESMFLADVARRIILVVLFDDRTTLGLVRLKLKGIVDELARRFETVFARGATPIAPTGAPAGAPGAGARGMTGALGAEPAPLDLLAGAEDEIDRLFS
jgi:predicted regulator of Ras-like GTPase activity (Roadblock/LC7/MglB family)